MNCRVRRQSRFHQLIWLDLFRSKISTKCLARCHLRYEVAYQATLKRTGENTGRTVAKHANGLIFCIAASLSLGWNGSFQTSKLPQARSERAHCTARRIVGLRHRFLGCHLDYDGRGKEAIKSSLDEARCIRSCEKVGPQLSVGRASGECVTAPIQDLSGFGTYLGCYLQSGGREMVHTPDVVSEVECATLCS